MSTPTVSIIGRPNVGKSTLFNRLVGKRQAIVHDLPGITRDRIFGSYEVDEGYGVHLVDTGGLVPGDDPLGLGDQVLLAVMESHVLLLVVDGKEGLTTADQRVWQEVRKSGKPAVLVVNKGDTRLAQEQFAEFYALGLDRQVLVSAEHGLGIGDLREALLELLPEGGEEETLGDDVPALAIVGRPNVGKSSLVNRLLGHERVLVSPVAGTTRDPIDSELRFEEHTFRLIDTAGIRRRSQVTGAAEEIAVLFARRQIERADLAILVVDSAEGVTTGDLAIAGTAWEMGRPVVVALNKWDLLDEEGREHLEESWTRASELLANPPRVNISALTSRRVDRLLPAVVDLLERSKVQLGTGELNRLFEGFLRDHQPPQHRGRPWRIYYCTQVSGKPPTFMLFANRTLERSNTYRRYLENRLREALSLDGVPVRLVIRKRT
jgi:GTP-binding protein